MTGRAAEPDLSTLYAKAPASVDTKLPPRYRPPPSDGALRRTALALSFAVTSEWRIMHLVDPDILEAAQGLNLPVCIAGVAIGLFLWLMGGWGQRFWLVLASTAGAGAYGLSVAESYDVQPLVAGLLMAVAGGALALSLVRPAAFAGGGVAACLLMERMAAGWNEPFIVFFVGGFLGLFLLRYWLMALCSLAGTLLMAYSGLWLLDALRQLDAVQWAGQRPVLLDWACGGVAALGFLIQLIVHRRRRSRNDHEEQEPEERVTGWRLWPFGSSGETKRRRAA